MIEYKTTHIHRITKNNKKKNKKKTSSKKERDRKRECTKLVELLLLWQA